MHKSLFGLAYNGDRRPIMLFSNVGNAVRAIKRCQRWTKAIPKEWLRTHASNSWDMYGHNMWSYTAELLFIVELEVY